MRYGCIKDGLPVGSILERSHLQMKEWGHEEEDLSVALRIETIALSTAWLLAMLAAITAFVGPSPAEAHPGGLAADGCHNDRKNGGRHCHHRDGDGKACE